MILEWDPDTCGRATVDAYEGVRAAAVRARRVQAWARLVADDDAPASETPVLGAGDWRQALRIDAQRRAATPRGRSDVPFYA